MATELDVAIAPPESFTQEEVERVRQYEKIVKLSETITSGKHPRIKVPASLVLSAGSTTSASRPAGAARNAHTGVAKANERAHGANNAAKFVAALPGLGLSQNEAVGDSTQPIGFASQRARIEAQLREQASHTSKPQAVQSSDFLVDEVLQKARQLEKLFTPPPLAISDNTAAGKQVPSESGDDDTFYSSKFNTPEFGLAARIPTGSDHDDVSMRDDSSDYEPELDTVPSTNPLPPPPALPVGVHGHQAMPAPLPPALLTQQDANQVASSFPNMSSEAATQILASLVAIQVQNTTQAVPIPPPSFPNSAAAQGPWQTNSATSTSGRPPVVRTHDLSPVAPQPEHISTLAVSTRLSNVQRGSFLGPVTQASLQQGDVSQSSPDSSPQVAGRVADRKKERKKKGKRKAGMSPVSPRIKSEPRSPSPIAAPLAPPASKRQRQGARPAAAPARQAEYSHEEEYNPASQHGHVAPRGQYGTARVVRDSRAPIVYERIEPGRYEQPPGVVVSRPVRAYEAYEPAPASYVPRHAQPSYQPPSRPASTIYGQPPSQQLPGPRGAVPVGYPAPAPRGVPSGRVSVRPDALERGHHRSPDMAPPPARVQRVSPVQGRILVDEYEREYLEPVGSVGGAEPRQPNIIETVAYDPNVAFERPPSRQVYATAAPRYARYGEDDVVYHRTSPVFAPARRVFTQPEYVAREYVDYPPQREYSLRPVQYADAAPAGHGGPALEEVPPREYLVRAATARPVEVPRYEMPPQTRYVERVGSVRPPDSGLGPSRGGALVYETGGASRGYDDRMRAAGMPQHVADNVYVDDRHGRELAREYSARPDAHAGGPREYSMRAAPAAAAAPAPPSALMPEVPYYPDQHAPPMNRPPLEYVFDEEGVPHEVYR